MPKKVSELTDDEFIKRAKELYEHVNVDEELLYMDGWFLSNPNRKKTRKFITNWLSRSNKRNKPIVVNKPVPKYYKPRPVVHCVACDSTGIVEAKRGNCLYAFKCPECDNHIGNYPKWTHEYRRKGFKPLLQDKDWNTDDLISKGLIFLGKKSKAWMLAPEECKATALELWSSGWRPVVNEIKRG